MPINHKQPYDDNNIFARILRGELPSKAVHETQHSLAFHDLSPLAAVHVLNCIDVYSVGNLAKCAGCFRKLIYVLIDAHSGSKISY